MLDASNARASKPAAVRASSSSSCASCGYDGLDFDHEAIELRLGERIGSFVFDRVLRRAEQKWLRQRIGDAVDRNARLFHRFEQRRLRFGRRAVHFVGEHDVGHDRTGARRELRRLRIEDRRADDVGGHQVRRECDAPEI